MASIVQQTIKSMNFIEGIPEYQGLNLFQLIGGLNSLLSWQFTIPSILYNI